MRSALCRAWRIVNLKNCRLLTLLDKVLSGSHKAKIWPPRLVHAYLLWCFMLLIPHFDSEELTVSS